VEVPIADTQPALATARKRSFVHVQPTTASGRKQTGRSAALTADVRHCSASSRVWKDPFPDTQSLIDAAHERTFVRQVVCGRKDPEADVRGRLAATHNRTCVHVG